MLGLQRLRGFARQDILEDDFRSIEGVGLADSPK